MKKLLTFLALLLFSIPQLRAQHSCCTTASMAFAEMGTDPAFIAAHAEPAPLAYEPQFGRFVSLKTSGGPEARAFEAKPAAGDGKIILLFHEWWGLNDYMIREAEKIAHETGKTVLALDLFDGKVTADREEAAKLSSGVNPDRILAIIQAGLDYAGKSGRIQTLGWCFGGAWSLQAAIKGGDRVVGCVMYYGMPEQDTTRLALLKAPVLGIFGTKDGFITPKVVDRFQSDMKSLNKPLEVKMYDAVHAFANPSNPQFDKVAAADANKRAIAFLNANFEKAKTVPLESK